MNILTFPCQTGFSNCKVLIVTKGIQYFAVTTKATREKIKNDYTSNQPNQNQFRELVRNRSFKSRRGLWLPSLALFLQLTLDIVITRILAGETTLSDKKIEHFRKWEIGQKTFQATETQIRNRAYERLGIN